MRGPDYLRASQPATGHRTTLAITATASGPSHSSHAATAVRSHKRAANSSGVSELLSSLQVELSRIMRPR